MATSMRRSLIAGRLALCIVGVLAACVHAAPKSVKATYNGYLSGMQVGVISEHFQADGGNYRVVSETKTIGLARFVKRQPLNYLSTGRLTPEGLRPVHFEGRRNAGEEPQYAARFDWTQSELTLRHDGKVQSISLPPGTQDRLSVMYQLMFLPLERMRLIDLPMTNGRKLDRYRYRVTPDVEIETPIGRLKTLHLVKQHEPGESGAEVWVSPQHHYFPVKVVIVEKNGMRFEQVIQTLELRD
jgi:hypothetical protein